MKFIVQKNENGEIPFTMVHNNKAPGILRVGIVDSRAQKVGCKMPDIKKAPEFRKIVTDYLGKPESDLLFRFNKNLGVLPGILIQDAKNAYQPADAKNIVVEVQDDTPAAPPAAPVAETPAEIPAPVTEVPTPAVETPVTEVAQEPVAEVPATEVA